jgi:RNA polymerase sigma-70 factor (ECF subfamily)
MEKDQRVALLRGVVDQLKPSYRRMIELRYFEEKSYEEIAEELNVPIGTVKIQLFRAKELLEGLLTKHKDI